MLSARISVCAISQMYTKSLFSIHLTAPSYERLSALRVRLYYLAHLGAPPRCAANPPNRMAPRHLALALSAFIRPCKNRMTNRRCYLIFLAYIQTGRAVKAARRVGLSA